MNSCERPCQKMLTYKPPRIAMTLLAIATLIQVLPLIPTANFQPHVTVGVILITVGFGIMIRAWWIFQKHETAICPTAETTSFVTDDIYAYSRNPMYLGMIMMLAGIALLAGSWPYYVAATLYALILNRVFCRYEEAKLLLRYGSQYTEYSANVRRWI